MPVLPATTPDFTFENFKGDEVTYSFELIPGSVRNYSSDGEDMEAGVYQDPSMAASFGVAVNINSDAQIIIEMLQMIAKAYARGKEAIPSVVESGTYKWTASGGGTDEYYMEADAGGDPGLFQREPERIYESGQGLMTKGEAGSLAAGEWDWTDNDSLGFDTVYVRLTDGADPDGKGNGFLKAGYPSVSWPLWWGMTQYDKPRGTAGGMRYMFASDVPTTDASARAVFP